MRLVILSVLMLALMTGCTSKQEKESMMTTPNSSQTQVNETPKQVSPTQTSSPEAKTGKITPQEAHDALAKDSSIILLDVRTQEEYAQKHIPGSILLPDTEVEQEIEKLIPDKSSIVYVYCRSGRRSATAAKIMVEKGYSNVFDLGGIESWPFETESGE